MRVHDCACMCVCVCVWRAEVKVNLDIKTRVQTFRGKARFKNAIRDLK